MTCPSTLPWSPRPSDDWVSELKGIDVTDNFSATAKLIELSKYGLNEIQLNKLGKVISEISPSEETLTPVRLHIIGDLTLEHLIGPIAGTAIRWGMNARVTVSFLGKAGKNCWLMTQHFGIKM